MDVVKTLFQGLDGIYFYQNLFKGLMTNHRKLLRIKIRDFVKFPKMLEFLRMFFKDLNKIKIVEFLKLEHHGSPRLNTQTSWNL